jgi:peptidoglycan/xylan/chitin deacetylase (PgdA/CDA1 family)
LPANVSIRCCSLNRAFWISRLANAILLLFALSAVGGAQTHWAGSWAASQMLAEQENAIGPDYLRDITLRQVVRLSIGGEGLRVHFSNRFGSAPLHLASVHIARPTSSESEVIAAGTDRTLTFGGAPDVWVPAGAECLSDPIDFVTAPLSSLAITLHLDVVPVSQTGHLGSRATSYLVYGDRVSATDFADAKRVEHWYFISGVDVLGSADAASLVILGDSITDGHGATTNANNRWPDVLANRLQTSLGKRAPGVLNQGIGGNRLLLDGLGPNALARFDHDVLEQAGVRYLIILEGVNDLGMMGRNGEVPRARHDEMVRRIIAAYKQMITRARSRGLQVIGATFLPFVGSEFYHPDASIEANRRAVNDWIRESGHFDGIVDFDAVMRDPEHPERLLAAFDSGDHLHPSPAGYAAMANAVPLTLFSRDFTSPKIAITFDDLPAHGSLPPATTRVEIAQKILAALRNAGMPPAFGFVNGVATERHAGDAEALAAWRAAGQPLGNHTWSHMNLNTHSLEEFEAEVSRNEPLLKDLMKDADWHWFRFPYLAEGDTPEKKAGVRAFLKHGGYKVAGVTMSFSDYLWTEPYFRCRTKGDSRAIQALEDSYLSAAEEGIEYYRSMSRALHGRDIPYVLLLHIGALDAEMLPRLLQLYRSKGFSFVTLQEAEADEFYRNSVELELPPGLDSIEGAMAARGLSLPVHASYGPLLDAVCR